MSGGLTFGGAWDCSVVMRAVVVVVGNPMSGSRSARATYANGMVADVGWPTSTCVDGIVLQQSSP